MRAISLLSILIAVFLAACATAPPPRPQARVAFDKKPAILVPAGKVVFDDKYLPPLVPPNIEHKFQTRPALIVAHWASVRLKTIVGAPGTLTVTLTDGGVTEKPLTVKTDWRHMFDRQPDRELTGHLGWRLAYEGPSLTWSTGGTATSVHTVPEQSTLNEVDENYNAMLESLAEAFDAKLAQQLAELSDALAQASARVSKR
jgi:hypothetical protein